MLHEKDNKPGESKGMTQKNSNDFKKPLSKKEKRKIHKMKKSATSVIQDSKYHVDKNSSVLYPIRTIDSSNKLISGANIKSLETEGVKKDIKVEGFKKEEVKKDIKVENIEGFKKEEVKKDIKVENVKGFKKEEVKKDKKVKNVEGIQLEDVKRNKKVENMEGLQLEDVKKDIKVENVEKIDGLENEEVKKDIKVENVEGLQLEDVKNTEGLEIEDVEAESYVKNTEGLEIEDVKAKSYIKNTKGLQLEDVKAESYVKNTEGLEIEDVKKDINVEGSEIEDVKEKLKNEDNQKKPASDKFNCTSEIINSEIIKSKNQIVNCEMVNTHIQNENFKIEIDTSKKDHLLKEKIKYNILDKEINNLIDKNVEITQNILALSYQDSKKKDTEKILMLSPEKNEVINQKSEKKKKTNSIRKKQHKNEILESDCKVEQNILKENNISNIEKLQDIQNSPLFPSESYEEDKNCLKFASNFENFLNENSKKKNKNIINQNEVSNHETQKKYNWENKDDDILGNPEQNVNFIREIQNDLLRIKNGFKSSQGQNDLNLFDKEKKSEKEKTKNEFQVPCNNLKEDYDHNIFEDSYKIENISNIKSENFKEYLNKSEITDLLRVSYIKNPQSSENHNSDESKGAFEILKNNETSENDIYKDLCDILINNDNSEEIIDNKIKEKNKCETEIEDRKSLNEINKDKSIDEDVAEYPSKIKIKDFATEKFIPFFCPKEKNENIHGNYTLQSEIKPTKSINDKKKNIIEEDTAQNLNQMNENEVYCSENNKNLLNNPISELKLFKEDSVQNLSQLNENKVICPETNKNLLTNPLSELKLFKEDSVQNLNQLNENEVNYPENNKTLLNIPFNEKIFEDKTDNKSEIFLSLSNKKSTTTFYSQKNLQFSSNKNKAIFPNSFLTNKKQSIHDNTTTSQYLQITNPHVESIKLGEVEKIKGNFVISKKMLISKQTKSCDTLTDISSDIPENTDKFANQVQPIFKSHEKDTLTSQKNDRKNIFYGQNHLRNRSVYDINKMVSISLNEDDEYINEPRKFESIIKSANISQYDINVFNISQKETIKLTLTPNIEKHFKIHETELPKQQKKSETKDYKTIIQNYQKGISIHNFASSVNIKYIDPPHEKKKNFVLRFISKLFK